MRIFINGWTIPLTLVVNNRYSWAHHLLNPGHSFSSLVNIQAPCSWHDLFPRHILPCDKKEKREKSSYPAWPLQISHCLSSGNNANAQHCCLTADKLLQQHTQERLTSKYRTLYCPGDVYMFIPLIKKKKSLYKNPSYFFLKDLLNMRFWSNTIL